MKRFLALLLTFILSLSLVGCSLLELFPEIADEILEETQGSDEEQTLSSDIEEPSSSDTDISHPTGERPVSPGEIPHIVFIPDEEDYCYDVESVVLYLHAYGHLPGNYVTKATAQKAHWNGGSVDPYIKDAAIGGDRFGNREGLLPKGHTYTECDIDTYQSERGVKRLVFSDDGRYYYTDDHYASFRELFVNEKGGIEWK